MIKADCKVGMYVVGEMSGVVLRVTHKSSATFEGQIIEQHRYGRDMPDQHGKITNGWPYNLFKMIHYIGATHETKTVGDLV